MHELLEQIFSTGRFRTAGGEEVVVHSETPRDQCLYLQNLIREGGYSRSLEIGFAFGLSALAIAEAVAAQGGRHLVIDKYEYKVWGGHGVDLINQSGLRDQVEFHEVFCYELLPELLKAGRRFDFAYIDSTKLFDWLLVDFFYLDKMLEPGGLIVFDDLKFNPIKKLMRYISQLPHYEVFSRFPAQEPEELKWKLGGVLRHVPGAQKLLRDELLLSDQTLGLNARCVALRKKADDERDYDWHVRF